MEELNTPIFAQAKVEYTSQLVDILYTHMFDGVKSIYDESKLIYLTQKGTPILLLFRELLEKVPIWNGEIIDSECSRIINNSKCDWIDDLITAVFISHTKILTSIGPNQSFQKINVTIPKTSTFIHKSYINTARELWKNPYLFNENIPAHEFQRNNKEIENIIKKCIEKTIRNLLPIKEILKEHLEGETDSILNQKETLKQLLREELKNILPKSDILKESDQNYMDSDSDNVDELDLPMDEAHTPISPRLVSPSVDPTSDEPSPTVTLSGPSIVNENTSQTDLLPSLTDKLALIAEKEKQIIDELNRTQETFTSSGDPTEAQVEKSCTDIIVNDITIPVDVPTSQPMSADPVIPVPAPNPVSTPNPDPVSAPDPVSTPNPVSAPDSVSAPDPVSTPNPVSAPDPVPIPAVEVIYDNVDLSTTTENVDPDRIKRLMTNMEVKKEVSVIKSNEIATSSLNNIPEALPVIDSEKPVFSFNNLYANVNKTENMNENNNVNKIVNKNENTNVNVNENTVPVVSPLQIITEDKPALINEPKSPRKEMVIVKNEDDIDETSSLANFFDDMKKIVEEKGIKVEINNDKTFTLFEDASEVEK